MKTSFPRREQRRAVRSSADLTARASIALSPDWRSQIPALPLAISSCQRAKAWKAYFRDRGPAEGTDDPRRCGPRSRSVEVSRSVGFVMPNLYVEERRYRRHRGQLVRKCARSNRHRCWRRYRRTVWRWRSALVVDAVLEVRMVRCSFGALLSSIVVSEKA